MANPFADPLAHLRAAGIRPSNETDRPYMLTPDSVSPKRIVGYGAFGEPIEETIATNHGEPMIHPCGAVNDCPMSTHPCAMGYHEQGYRTQLLRDLIRDGWIPLSVCVYTRDYQAVTGRPCLVDNPEGIADCNGKPDGCEHTQAEMARRTTIAKAKHQKLEDASAQSSPAEAQALLRRLGAALDLTQQRAERAEPEPTTDNRAPKRPSMKGSE